MSLSKKVAHRLTNAEVKCQNCVHWRKLGSLKPLGRCLLVHKGGGYYSRFRTGGEGKNCPEFVLRPPGESEKFMVSGS